MVEKGFELSEASHAPVMLELRIRACHATGEFAAKDNRKGIDSGLNKLAGPPVSITARLAHPPVTYAQEKLKIDERLPAARHFIREHKLNETLRRRSTTSASSSWAASPTRCCARSSASALPMRSAPRASRSVLNVAYPLVPEEIREFCAGKRAVLIVEEGYPDYIEQAINVELRRADIQTRMLGKGALPLAGEYTADVLLDGLAAFLQAARAQRHRCRRAWPKKRAALIAKGRKQPQRSAHLPPRPPTFCTGCPERPVFSAIKLMQRELGPTHITADIGCHSFATFAPF